MFLLLIPLVSSITFYTDKSATIWAVCKNNTYVESTANLTIRYPNSTVWIANATMTAITTGKFNYTFITPNITGNYLSSVICNIGGVDGFAEDDFWIRESEEEMTSMAVVIFLMILTVGVFFTPKFFRFHNKYLQSTMTGLAILFGLFLLSLDTAMVVTVAAKANLGINRELFRLLWLINWSAYLGMVIVVLSFGYNMLQAWKVDKQNKRMGYDDERE
ncbi:hypothetical protein LCGC14_0867780 [marine sediment metagenome]|uniref:Uncharacterized protein n=1 Tax=marine sediment metagenome TaxID=412755 RepID=A0A0F9SCL7_9ZZZZ